MWSEARPVNIPSARILKLNLAFPIGSTVFLICRNESLPGLVCGVNVRPNGIAYIVGWGDATESIHFDFELRADEEEPEPDAPKG
jgi:hypothetical protein